MALAQARVCLLCKCEVLSSNSSPTIKKKKKTYLLEMWLKEVYLPYRCKALS
jgi:hypothetical protein